MNIDNLLFSQDVRNVCNRSTSEYLIHQSTAAILGFTQFARGPRIERAPRAAGSI